MTTGDGTTPGRGLNPAADAARARLARALRDSGQTPSARRCRPRSSPCRGTCSCPSWTPAAAYQDEALVIKYGADGLPVSSSSQPAMMAIMLEQLGLRAGAPGARDRHRHRLQRGGDGPHRRARAARWSPSTSTPT